LLLTHVHSSALEAGFGVELDEVQFFESGGLEQVRRFAFPGTN